MVSSARVAKELDPKAGNIQERLNPEIPGSRLLFESRNRGNGLAIA